MFIIHNIWVLTVGSLLSFLLLLCFLLPFLFGIRHAGSIAGTLLSLALLLYFSCNSLIGNWMQRIWANGIGHVLLCVFLGTLAVCIVGGLVCSLQMLLTILKRPKQSAPAIVLGCTMNNSLQKRMLSRRIDAAYAYLTKFPEAKAILSGGSTGRSAVSEAQWIKQALLERGIAEDRLLTEEASMTTYENLLNARRILEEKELGTAVTIITNGFHQRRCAVIAKELGLRARHTSARTAWYLIPCCWVRECLLLWKKLLFAW